jgi:hypothetical protein
MNPKAPTAPRARRKRKRTRRRRPKAETLRMREVRTEGARIGYELTQSDAMARLFGQGACLLHGAAILLAGERAEADDAMRGVLGRAESAKKSMLDAAEDAADLLTTFRPRR